MICTKRLFVHIHKHGARLIVKVKHRSSKVRFARVSWRHTLLKRTPLLVLPPATNSSRIYIASHRVKYFWYPYTSAVRNGSGGSTQLATIVTRGITGLQNTNVLSFRCTNEIGVRVVPGAFHLALEENSRSRCQVLGFQPLQNNLLKKSYSISPNKDWTQYS